MNAHTDAHTHTHAHRTIHTHELSTDNALTQSPSRVPGTWIAMGIMLPSGPKCSRQMGAQWCCL
jgi:hypothetical protein